MLGAEDFEKLVDYKAIVPALSIDKAGTMAFQRGERYAFPPAMIFAPPTLFLLGEADNLKRSI